MNNMRINKLAASLGFTPLEEEPKDPEKVRFDRATYKEASALYMPELIAIVLDMRGGIITVEEAKKSAVPISRKIVDAYLRMMDEKEEKENPF